MIYMFFLVDDNFVSTRKNVVKKNQNIFEKLMVFSKPLVPFCQKF